MQHVAVKYVLFALAAFAAVCVVVTLLRAYRLSTLKANTIASLTWSGGSPDDQLLLDRLRKYIDNAPRTELLSPEIASLTYYPNGDGIDFGVDWIGLYSPVDAIRFAFADGSCHDVMLSDSERASHSGLASKTLFFEAEFDDLHVPESIRPKLTDGLRAVVLLSGGRAISDERIPPVYVHKEYHGSIASDFVDGVLQYDLPAESEEGNHRLQWRPRIDVFEAESRSRGPAEPYRYPTEMHGTSFRTFCSLLHARLRGLGPNGHEQPFI